ncbi:unnamed protein product [Leptosia nina]|uniref:Uncharacterized protein n=1 Tax=Leptosia nina TaxID=320188 RepID=A0AAV1JNX6_9NEOP
MCFLNVLRLHVSQNQRQKRLYKQYMEQLAGAYVEKCTDFTLRWDSGVPGIAGVAGPEWSYPDVGASTGGLSDSDSGRYSSPCCSEVIFNGGQHYGGKGRASPKFAVCYPGNFG